METVDVTNEAHVYNQHSPYAPNPKLSSPEFHRVYKLEFLYLFDFQIVCIYHLSRIVHSLSSCHFRFKVCKLESHVYLLSKRASTTWVWHSRVYQVSTLGLGFTNWSSHICLLSKRTSAIWIYQSKVCQVSIWILGFGNWSYCICLLSKQCASTTWVW
jgi:hypothetical protein